MKNHKKLEQEAFSRLAEAKAALLKKEKTFARRLKEIELMKAGATIRPLDSYLVEMAENDHQRDVQELETRKMLTDKISEAMEFARREMEGE